jgi:hypothetical protein
MKQNDQLTNKIYLQTKIRVSVIIYHKKHKKYFSEILFIHFLVF